MEEENVYGPDIVLHSGIMDRLMITVIRWLVTVVKNVQLDTKGDSVWLAHPWVVLNNHQNINYATAPFSHFALKCVVGSIDAWLNSRVVRSSFKCSLMMNKFFTCQKACEGTIIAVFFP